MENVVEYYAGKINHVVLYCNKAITASGKSYAKIVELLNKSEISIELITNEEILDIVRKYPYLANYYFGVNVITFDWIIAHDEKSFNTLGERFNREFNVETETSKKLSLFARNQNAIQYINRKKEKLLQKSLIWKTIQKIMLIISKKSRQWFCLLKILIVEHSNMHLNGISVYNLL